jgi:hypothetical protein
MDMVHAANATAIDRWRHGRAPETHHSKIRHGQLQLRPHPRMTGEKGQEARHSNNRHRQMPLRPHPRTNGEKGPGGPARTYQERRESNFERASKRSREKEEKLCNGKQTAPMLGPPGDLSMCQSPQTLYPETQDPRTCAAPASEGRTFRMWRQLSRSCAASPVFPRFREAAASAACASAKPRPPLPCSLDRSLQVVAGRKRMPCSRDMS